MISIVIPVYNEEETIPELFERSIGAISKISETFEIICIDDGSKDSSLQQLQDFHEQDKRFKVLSLSRNFGHQAAILAGLNYAKGDFIGIMDGDLQDPPEVFEFFLSKLNEGYDVVYAIREKRKEGPFKKMLYWLYYRILRMVSSQDIPLDSGDFCLMRKVVRDKIIENPEQSLFIRGIRHWVGFRQIGMSYERSARFAGETKYSIKKLMQLAYNGIFSFSSFPIKFLGRLGFLSILASIGYLIYLAWMRWSTGDVPQGFTTLILVIMFFGGVQLVSVRILGEYIHRIYDESRDRPLYIVKEEHLD